MLSEGKKKLERIAGLIKVLDEKWVGGFKGVRGPGHLCVVGVQDVLMCLHQIRQEWFPPFLLHTPAQAAGSPGARQEGGGPEAPGVPPDHQVQVRREGLGCAGLAWSMQHSQAVPGISKAECCREALHVTQAVHGCDLIHRKERASGLTRVQDMLQQLNNLIRDAVEGK